MRTPQEIYQEYNIMPNLQLHQLRVAAVGKMLAEHFNEPVNVRDVVLACLFHDMGNIVKFKLDAFPEALLPEGLEYWEKQKAAVIEKYGPAQHHVSEAIAQELGLPETVIHMIGSSGVSRLPEIVGGNSNELKILEYADLRVAPKGIVSLAERFADFAVRYPGEKDTGLLEAANKLEQQLFSHASIKSEDISDSSVAPIIEELKGYWVSEG